MEIEMEKDDRKDPKPARPAFAASLLKALSERLRFMTAKYK